MRASRRAFVSALEKQWAHKPSSRFLDLGSLAHPGQPRVDTSIATQQ